MVLFLILLRPRTDMLYARTRNSAQRYEKNLIYAKKITKKCKKCKKNAKIFAYVKKK